MRFPAGPELRAIHVPTPQAWPPAPGWWVLAGVVLVLVGLLAWRGWRHRFSRRRRQRVEAELQALLDRHGSDGDAAAFATGVSALLRRAARLRDPTTVPLQGAAWLDALDRLTRGKVDVSALEGLEPALYRPDAGLDVPRVADVAGRTLHRLLRQGGGRA